MSTPLGVAFGRYTLPRDDRLAELEPTITVLEGGEDPAYPVSNWSYRKPGRPAKFLSAFEVAILFDFGSAVDVAAFAAIYHNFDPGTPLTLQWGSTVSASDGSHAIEVPDWTTDFHSVSPWDEIPGQPSRRYWILHIGGSTPENTNPYKLGRPAFLGALRDLGNDVRWGVVHEEQHGAIVHPTLFGVETVYAIGGRRQALNGELALRHEDPYLHAQEFIAFQRSTQALIYPWILIPDVLVNDAWMVRFVDDRWSRTYETLNHNIFPFRVRELARGHGWPSTAQ